MKVGEIKGNLYNIQDETCKDYIKYIVQFYSPAVFIKTIVWQLDVVMLWSFLMPTKPTK